MNKRIVSLLVAVVMVCSMLATAVLTFAAPSDSGMHASVTEAYAGQTFTVTMRVPGFGKQISDLSLKVKFNKDIFEVVEFTAPPLTGMSITASTPAEANGNGFFAAAYNTPAGDADVTFTGMDFTATFKVKDGAALGDYTFDVSNDVAVGSINEENGWPDTLMSYKDFAIKSVTVKVVAAPIVATGISLNKTATTIYTGSTETLTATVTPADSTDTVTWTSSNPAVATVDSTGKVTAVSAGTATITATAGTKSATCAVTVEKAPCTHPNKSTVGAKDSTCKDKGWDAYQECDDCGKLFDMSGNAIDAIPYRDLSTNHTGGTATCTEQAVCTVCGASYGDLAEHTYTTVDAKDSTCAEKGWDAYQKCSVCHKLFDMSGNAISEIPFRDLSTNHTGGTATCTEQAVCTVCGASYGDLAAHTYTAETKSEDALKAAGTCQTEAVYYYSCAVCGAVEKNDEHTFLGEKDAENHVGEKTLTYDETNHWYACGCGAEIESAAHELEWVIDKEATETELGTKHQECKVCDFAGDPVEYEYVPPVTPATGDNSMLVLWAVMIVVSGMGLAAVMLFSRKRRA